MGSNSADRQIYSMAGNLSRLPDLLDSPPFSIQGLQHALQNSFRRNTISLPRGRTRTQPSTPLSYQAKLLNVDFPRSDLKMVLRHIFMKGSLSLGDRNLLRRIMLDRFGEEMIAAAGRDLVDQLEFKSMTAFEEVGCACRVWFILSGDMEVHTADFNYRAKAGEVFGQRELLLGIPILRIVCQNDALLLELPCSRCSPALKSFFASKFERLTPIIKPLLSLLKGLSPERTYALIDALQHVRTAPGDRVVRKLDHITHLYFIAKTNHSHVDNQANHRLACLGLAEICTNRKFFEETVNCLYPEPGTLYRIELISFQKIVLPSMGELRAYFRQQCERNWESAGRNPEEVPFGSISDFTAAKSIRLGIQRRRQHNDLQDRKPQNTQNNFSKMRTEPATQISSKFIFLRPVQTRQTPSILVNQSVDLDYPNITRAQFSSQVVKKMEKGKRIDCHIRFKLSQFLKSQNK